MKHQPIIFIETLSEKNLLIAKPLYIGDADEGTEALAGYERIYKWDDQIYITRDDNKEQDENLIATMTVDFFNENF